jgi:hypothetical protein
MHTRALAAIFVLGAVVFQGLDSHVLAQSPYYQGKTIKLIQGREPDGSGDNSFESGRTVFKEIRSGEPHDQ